MTSSTRARTPAAATTVEVSDDALTVVLSDGRTVSAPLSWFPRLLHGTPKERSNSRLIGRGLGIHWPDLDEDISVEGLLAGHPSGESPASLARWLAGRGATIRPRTKRTAQRRPRI